MDVTEKGEIMAESETLGYTSEEQAIGQARRDDLAMSLEVVNTLASHLPNVIARS